MNKHTKKVKVFLSDKKKVKYISSWKSLAKFLGLSHQHIYSRKKSHSWTKAEVYALGKLFDIRLCDTNEQITDLATDFLNSQKKEKIENIWTRKRMAKHLKMSLSLLYQRFDSGNWKEDEIIKIKDL